MTGNHREPNRNPEAQLDALFRAYRAACPDPEAGPNFMPGIWARIEARENSATIFSRMAKALVTFAVATSVLLGLMVSMRQSDFMLPADATYLEALTADQHSTLDPLHFERIADLEQE